MKAPRDSRSPAVLSQSRRGSFKAVVSVFLAANSTAGEGSELLSTVTLGHHQQSHQAALSLLHTVAAGEANPPLGVHFSPAVDAM